MWYTYTTEERGNMPDEGDQTFGQYEKQVIDRLVALLTPDRTRPRPTRAAQLPPPAYLTNLDIHVCEVDDLDDVDELAAVLEDDAIDEGAIVHIVPRSGQTPSTSDVRNRVMGWLDERNPVFGYATPRSFMLGD